MSTGFLPAQALKKKEDRKVKDQGEHDVFSEVAKTTDPAKRLQLLDSWKQKYSDTDFKEERLVFYLTTYQALGQGVKMAEAAKELLALDPAHVQALYWLTLLTETLPVNPDSLATGEKAARGLLNAKKPEAVKDDDWGKMKKEFEVLAHKTLGFTAWQRKDFSGAEKEYARVLELSPAFAPVSYSLGMVILGTKNPDRQPEMLYHWARAASYSGVGELAPPDFKKKIDAFFVKAYNTYHGSEEGLKELRAAALTSPVPPSGFNIKSKAEIDNDKRVKFEAENPLLAKWMAIKEKLRESDGEQYFEREMKGAAVPKFKGKVVSTKPALRPKEIVIAIEKADVGEVTLKMETPMPGKADPGAEIEFEGVPSAFTKEPFMVTFDVESKDKISGWPAAAPVRRAPVSSKKGATKKKG
ncbi:MAG: hypothetical protein ACRD8O_17455 [Bryobacteraceae bacterium]